MFWPIQQAVYQRLTGHAPLMALVTGVFDHVPQEAPFAFVVVGDGDHDPEDDDRTTGFECDLPVHVWDRHHRGRKGVKIIQEEIWTALHRQTFPVTGGTVVDCRVTLSETFRDSDGASWHGVQRVALHVR